MGERPSVSGAVMCFFGWGSPEEREHNIGEVVAVPLTPVQYERIPVDEVVIRLQPGLALGPR